MTDPKEFAEYRPLSQEAFERKMAEVRAQRELLVGNAVLLNRTIAEQAALIEKLREALRSEREDVLWNAYATGNTRDGMWSHLFMSDGEWLARECGFDPKQGNYPDDEVKAAIPVAAANFARAALKEGSPPPVSQKEPQA